jgi:hypothetical protein
MLIFNLIIDFDMKKRFTSGLFIVLAGAATLNIHLNRQNNLPSVYLAGIETLASEVIVSDDLFDPIYLEGCLVSPYPKSASYNNNYTIPFQATKSSSCINVRYLANLNNITIQIVRASGGTAYSTVVNTVAGGQLPVSLSGLSSGEYTIVFTAPNGSSVYGDFEI